MASAASVSSIEAVLLYVEDEEAAALLFRVSLKKLQPATKLFIVESCQKALHFLHQQAPFEGMPRPHLVVLDFQLPDGTGLHILEHIRQHEHLAALPVVLFSTSKLLAFRQRAAELGAVGFILKPPGLAEFEHAVESIHAFMPKSPSPSHPE